MSNTAIRSLLILVFVMLSYFSTKPALASPSQASLYVQPDGSGLIRPNSSPRAKVGAVSCFAFPGEPNWSVFIEEIFASTNRQAPGQPRNPLGVKFNPESPAYMIASVNGRPGGSQAKPTDVMDLTQIVQLVLQAPGVPPFEAIVEGKIGINSLGYQAYSDVDGNRDIKLTCGTNLGDDLLPEWVRNNLREGLRELQKGAIIAYRTGAGVVNGLGAIAAAIVTAIFEAMSFFMQKSY